VVVVISVVVGNPKVGSRTLQSAVMIAERLTGRAPDVVIDVAELGPGLLGWGDDKISAAVQSVARSDYLVCASPTFKATYTGLLKLFLDQVPTDGLAGVTAFPVMLGGGPYHAMAPELLLKPVLVELGATCPTKGLYVLDSEWETSPVVDAWVSTARSFVTTEASV
jgi:FMN reductase